MTPRMFHRPTAIALLTSSLGISSLIYPPGLSAQIAVTQPVASSPLVKVTELPAVASPVLVSQLATNVSALNLLELLEAAAASYPMLVAARTEARASAQDVKAAERARWPSVSATVESDTGNLRSYPNKAVQVDQTIWDAGRNSSRISESKALADISLLKVYLQQQDVFLQIANAWQNMIASRERLAVAERTLQRLRTYQAQMRRRVQAEASPLIDLELVDSRLLQTEVEASTAKMSLQVSLTRLEQFSGLNNLLARSAQAMYPASLSDTDAYNRMLDQIDWVQAAAAHPLVAKARLEVT